MTWEERTVGIEQIFYRPDWLSIGEAESICGRSDHSGGCAARLLVKQMISERYQTVDHFGQIHIESRDGRGRSSRPQAYINGRMIPWNISLSHSERVVSAAIVSAGKGQVGIDLVDLMSVSTRPLLYWFSADESERAYDHIATGVIWSLKEAIYKATNEGTRFLPRHIDTASYLSATEWRRLGRTLRLHKKVAGTMRNGHRVSVELINGTIKTLVWCPARRDARRMSA